MGDPKSANPWRLPAACPQSEADRDTLVGGGADGEGNATKREKSYANPANAARGTAQRDSVTASRNPGMSLDWAWPRLVISGRR